MPAAPEFRIVSLGTLAAHPLWEEKHDVRTGHATTTLISLEGAEMLVNPGLPGQVLEARLDERARVPIDRITHVFLTSFTVDHIRGLAAFPEAIWLIHEPERDAARARLDDAVEHAEADGDPEVVRQLKTQIELLERCRVADDHLAPGVDLFPLPGITPGCCGLLLPLPVRTVLIAGDAVATQEHFDRGQVLPWCADIEAAQESFREAIEIADVIVPGRDNVVLVSGGRRAPSLG